MAADSVSAHVAAQQKKWESYLAEHAIEKIYRDMTAEMISEQPENPVTFMFNYLKRNFPKDVPSETRPAPAANKGVTSAPKGPFVANPAFQQQHSVGRRGSADDGPGDESEEEDDEDDYADFVPMKQNADNSKKRGSVAAAKIVVDKDWEPPAFEKSKEKETFLITVLHKLFFLESLTKKEILVLATAMKQMDFAAGEVIIAQGDEGDKFYIVDEGICDIEVEGVGKVMEIPCPDKRDPTQQRLYFGELALLYDAPRAATVKARGGVTTWALDRHTFKSILQDTEKKKIMLYSKFIQSVPIFQNMTIAQTNTLCNSLVGADYMEGEVIIEEGAVGREFFLIEQGTAECFKHIDGKAASVAHVKAGDFFGELALQRDEPRAATVRATTELSVVKIDRDTFKRMIGNLRGITRDWSSAK